MRPLQLRVLEGAEGLLLSKGATQESKDDYVKLAVDGRAGLKIDLASLLAVHVGIDTTSLRRRLRCRWARRSCGWS